MNTRIFTAALLAGLLSCMSGSDAAFAIAKGAIETRLTADVMDYDIDTGDFDASGNVILSREGVTITSDKGKANSKTQKARMFENVHAFGVHDNSPLDAKCDLLESDFSAPAGDYYMSGNVDAMFGPRILRSANARLIGNRFAAEKVTHFEDKTRNAVLACDKLDGEYDKIGILNATGVGSVYVIQEDKDKTSELWSNKLVYSRPSDTVVATGKAKMHVVQKNASTKETTVTGDKMVYSITKGTITVTGQTRAKQDGRDITAKTLIYHPDTGKVEAHGTPRIIVDTTRRTNTRSNNGTSRNRNRGKK